MNLNEQFSQHSVNIHRTKEKHKHKNRIMYPDHKERDQPKVHEFQKVKDFV